MTFAQRRNRLTTHFSERIPVVKRRMTVFPWFWGRIIFCCETRPSYRNYCQSLEVEKFFFLEIYEIHWIS